MRLEYTLRSVMQGTLDTFSVVEILQMLGKSRRSGTLHIECPNRQIDVHFVAGRIAETRDSTRVFTDTVLGSQLLKRALVNEQRLNEALAVQERMPRPLGTLLVESGHLHERDLREVLSRQVANTLVAVKVETSGTFVFVADPAAKAVDFITIDTHAVLMDISSLGGDYCLAIEALGQANTVLVRNKDFESLPRHSMTMGRDELCVLAQVDDHRTVREITASTSLEEITVVSVLGMLAEAGVVLVKAEKQTRAEADTELKAHRDSVWAEVSSLLDGLAGEGADPPGPAAGEAQAGDAGAADPGSAPAGGLDAPQLDWGKFVPE
jgi:hypothetical protein